MPKGTKVARCVEDVMKKGKAKPNAIRICQTTTGDSYATGKASKHGEKPAPKKTSPKKPVAKKKGK